MHYIRNLIAIAMLAVIASVVADPASAQLFGRKNNQSDVRLNEMEDRLRRLTGQIEQLAHEMRTLQDQMRRMQEDNEYRFQQLEGGSQPGRRSDAGQSGELNSNLAGSVQTLGTLNSTGDGQWGATGGLEQPSTDGGLASNGPIDLSALAGGGASIGLDNPAQPAPVPGATAPATDQLSSLGTAPSGGPRADYDQAYTYALNGQYPEAEQAFRTFIEAYPEDRLAANAQYWLGESLLAQGNYRDAADAFLKTYTNHPGNSKGPDSLLKLGLSLKGLGEANAACATFNELLNKFPSAPQAILEQARSERQSVQCS